MTPPKVTTEPVRRYRKRFVGTVVSDRMDKTRVVEVTRLTHHSVYKKIIRKRSKYKVHDERNESRPGDQVRIVETRPLSKDKRWRLEEILRRGSLTAGESSSGSV